MCNMQKDINNFYKKFSESKDCNRTRGLERYYKNKDKISNQRKLYHGKKRKNLITKTKQWMDTI